MELKDTRGTRIKRERETSSRRLARVSGERKMRERERSEERSEKASDRRIEKGRRAKDAEELEGWISRRGTKSHEAEF